tara:strand:- start:421 stop:1026 length:606 start_codon:yes stop_codon:yes gene_type:complete
MKFSEINKDINGHLEIWKHFSDGSKELHWEDQNVICSGMGATLAEMFDASYTAEVSNFQIPYFKVGVSGSEALQLSSTGDVSGELTQTQYGTGNLAVSVHNTIQNGAATTNDAFGVIPYPFIKRVTDTKCMWQIVLDEQTANVAETPYGPGGAEALNEIGLYSQNPYLQTTHGSLLCAYRYFKPVYKTDAFILVFRWTIEF